ncbi:MAG: NHL repeat-containing protein [Candidatus Hatepunaea meridiana]|nr:NHL repeat-containing protein [Candidatus Hatepunaea meridiana]
MKLKNYLTPIILLLISCNLMVSADGNNSAYIYPPWKHTWGVVRATPFKLRLFAGDKTHFDDPQGIAAVRLESWEDTTKTGDDDEITVYGVNSGDNCIIYNRSMFSLDIYGLDPNHVKFNKPWGIAADAKGRVYIADRGNSRIVRLRNTGKKLEYVGVLGELGDAPGMFVEPRGVALDPQGTVYVTDVALNRVTLFNDSSEIIDVWEGFTEPDGIAVVGPGEKWNYKPKQTFVIVIDSLHQRVRKLSLEGDLLNQTSAMDWGVKDAYLNYVVLDYHNQLIISDKNNGCLHKLDADLNYITSFGEAGKGKYQFDEPRGIAIYRRFGQLIISERTGAQYLWVAVDVSRFEAKVIIDSVWRDLSIDFEISEPAYCEIDVLDSYGRFVTRLSIRRRFPVGVGNLKWDLRVPRKIAGISTKSELPPQYKPGQRLPDGRYTLRGRFRATYSSREFFSKEVTTEFVIE